MLSSQIGHKGITSHRYDGNGGLTPIKLSAKIEERVKYKKRNEVVNIKKIASNPPVQFNRFKPPSRNAYINMVN